MNNTKNPRQASIDSAKMRGENRKHLGGDCDKTASELYPDDTELANAFKAGWNRESLSEYVARKGFLARP